MFNSTRNFLSYRNYIAKPTSIYAVNMLKRFHHTDNLSIRIVTTSNSVVIHPLNRYIFEWEINDKNGLESEFTQYLTNQATKRIIYDPNTESLIIPRPQQIPQVFKESEIPCNNQPWYSSIGIFVNVDLWMIPPSVISILMIQKRDSPLVTHRQLGIFIKPPRTI